MNDITLRVQSTVGGIKATNCLAHMLAKLSGYFANAMVALVLLDPRKSRFDSGNLGPLTLSSISFFDIFFFVAPLLTAFLASFKRPLRNNKFICTKNNN